MEWFKPYSIERKRFWLFWNNYKIIYDDCVIYHIIGGDQYYQDIKQIVGMLNGAYNMGYHQKEIEYEIEKGEEISGTGKSKS